MQWDFAPVEVLRYGYFIVGTAHLDYRDKNGCAGRIHGYSDVAENWFLGTISGVPGWSYVTDAWDFWNANSFHPPFGRVLGGQNVPHVYENNGLAYEVNVP